MADYIPPALDPMTRQQIDAIQRRSVEAPDALTSQYMQGADSGRGLLGQSEPQMIRDQSLRTPGDEGVTAAINQRASKKYDEALRDVGIKAQTQAKAQRFDRLQAAGSLVQRENQYNEQRQAMIRKAEQDARAARASTLGTILGIAGAVGGGILGSAGGPMGTAAGAGAGYQIGSGVGQSVGG